MEEDNQDSDGSQELEELASRQQEVDQRLKEMEDYLDNELKGIKERQKEMEKEIELEGLELINKQLEEINTRLNRLSDIITNNRKRIRQLKDISKRDRVLE